MKIYIYREHSSLFVNLNAADEKFIFMI